MSTISNIPNALKATIDKMEPDPIIAICIIIAVIAGCCFVRWWNKYETERKNKNKKEN